MGAVARQLILFAIFTRGKLNVGYFYVKMTWDKCNIFFRIRVSTTQYYIQKRMDLPFPTTTSIDPTSDLIVLGLQVAFCLCLMVLIGFVVQRCLRSENSLGQLFYTADLILFILQVRL